MRSKNSVVLLLLLTAMLALAGCGALEPAVSQTAITGTSAAQLQEEKLPSVVKDLAIAVEKDTTVVTLRFCDEEGNAASRVPSYQWQQLEQPGRIILSLEGITAWDYRVYENEMAPSCVQGVFHHNAMGNQPGELYVQLHGSAEAAVTESEGTLQLRLSPKDGEKSLWFALVDGFDLYPGNEKRILLDERGFYPCLCRDGSTVVLLSRGFDTRKAAQEALDAALEDLQTALPGRKPLLMELAPGQLPDPDAQSQMQSLAEEKLGVTSDGDITGAVLQADGRFLSWTREGGYLYAKGMQENGYAYEQLWRHENVSGELLPGVEFSSIRWAQLSFDGSYLAVVDEGQDYCRTAEVFDLKNGGHFLLSDLEMGTDTPTLAWDEKESRLYAISGEGEDLFYWTLFFDENGTPRVQKLAEEKAYESSLCFVDGALLCTRYVDGEPWVCRIQDGKPLLLGRGQYFTPSPDGGIIAIWGDDMEEESGFLYLLNPDTGTVTWVNQQESVLNAVWDADGRRLYYSVYEESQTDYPLKTRAYLCADGTSREASLILGTLFASPQPDEFLLVYIFRSASQEIPMTYRVSY